MGSVRIQNLLTARKVFCCSSSSPSSGVTVPFKSVSSHERRRSLFSVATAVRVPSLRVSSSSYSSVGDSTMVGDVAAVDSAMDAVQKRLMFEDECILVDEYDHVVGHDNKYNCHLMEKILSENLLHRAFSVFLFNSKYELLLQQRSPTKVTFPLLWTNTCCSHPLYSDSELIEENALGVRNAAQRKLLDELGIPAEDVPVDQFTPLGRILYKAPSDGKWGEHERNKYTTQFLGFHHLVLCAIHGTFSSLITFMGKITTTTPVLGLIANTCGIQHGIWDEVEGRAGWGCVCNKCSKWTSMQLVDYLLFIVRDVSVCRNPDEVADIKYVNRQELKELLRKADAGEEGVKLSPWFRLVVDNFLFKWWDHVENGTLNQAADMKTIHKL